MIQKHDQIREKIASGENSFVEFKEVLFGSPGVKSPNSKSLAAEMVAFANAHGGTIFLGVDDKRNIKGVPKNQIDEIEKWVVNIATNSCKPSIEPVITTEHLLDLEGNEATILVVKIFRGLYVYATSSGASHYIRVGSTKQLLSGPRLSRLIQNRERTLVFDELPIFTSTIDDLDEEKLNLHYERSSGLISRENLLQNTNVTRLTEGGKIYPTVAGLLFFGKRPQDHLKSAFIEAAVYRGTRRTSDDLVHAERIQGSVDTQIENAVTFVNRFMLKPARKPLGRVDYPQFDMHAIHEAIVNAVAHRDYSISGSKIRMFLYSDRIEISSPGGLPNTLTLESMAFRVFTRNQLLVHFLSRKKSLTTGRAFLESRGEGIQTILALSETHSGRSPEYNLYGDELLLTIWALPSPHLDRTD